MRVAHVILAHKNPNQVKRLVLSLNHPDSTILLHIDKKSNLKDFSDLIKLANVYFVKSRVSVNWGGFSQIEAVVNSFKELEEIMPHVDYVNVLSGQDYPVKSIADFYHFLRCNPGRAFMEFLPFDHPWVLAARNRFNKYHFTDMDFFGKFKIEQLLTHLLPKRTFPKGFKLVGKSQWFTIDNECLVYILKFVAEDKALYNKFKHSWGADELVFQSIIYNSKLVDKMVNNNLRYIDWSGNESSPKTLTILDKDKLLGSGAFFARKFDTNIDVGIVDFLEMNILNV